jgi:hypothetical protein
MARPTPPPPAGDPSPVAVRVQILATEHWSLLASRSTTQNEVLVRIGMFLTFVSATLVSLALVGQADAFGDAFRLVAIVLLATALLIGTLTQVRVHNVAMEDMMYVLAMNRLRGEYAELAPEVAGAFLSSAHDDEAGVGRTYYFLGPARGASQVFGSSALFIGVVNGTLAGLLVASIALLAGASTGLALAIGLVAGLVFVGAAILLGARVYFRFWRDWTPRHPSP